jgi:hypothetical protein
MYFGLMVETRMMIPVKIVLWRVRGGRVRKVEEVNLIKICCKLIGKCHHVAMKLLYANKVKKIWSHSVHCFITLIIVYFDVQKFFNLIQLHFSIGLIFWAIGVLFRKALSVPIFWIYFPTFFSSGFNILCSN